MSARDERADKGYPLPGVILVGLATLVAPLVTLLAALVLLDDEPSEARRRLLKAWALVSGVLVVLVLLVVVLVLAGLG